jgi:hypothetical protein
MVLKHPEDLEKPEGIESSIFSLDTEKRCDSQDEKQDGGNKTN